jgi:hypothetical protein
MYNCSGLKDSIAKPAWVIFKVMVLNATFNNISGKPWRSALLVEETWVSGENHHLPQVTDKLYHIMLQSTATPRHERDSSSQLFGDRH